MGNQQTAIIKVFIYISIPHLVSLSQWCSIQIRSTYECTHPISFYSEKKIAYFFSCQHALCNTQLVILVSNAAFREFAALVKWDGGPIQLDLEGKKIIPLIFQWWPGAIACCLQAWALGYIQSKLERGSRMHHFWGYHLAGKHAREREKKLWLNDRAN